MPVPAQNIICRDYANKHDLYLKLSVNELYFPNCFLNLFGLLDGLEDLNGVLMCSQFILPEDEKMRSEIYQRFLDRGCELHFVLESIIIHSEKCIEELETIFKLGGCLALIYPIEKIKTVLCEDNISRS